MTQKGAILGIGNVLHNDDGIGIKVLNYFDSLFLLPEFVELVDGGTSGATLNISIVDKEWIIIVDALDVSGQPGEVKRLDGTDFINRPASIKMSPHQIGFLDLIQLMRLEGTGPDPEQLTLIGIIPENTSHGTMISSAVDQALDEAVEMLLSILGEKGIHPVTRQPPLKPDYWWLSQ